MRKLSDLQISDLCLGMATMLHAGMDLGAYASFAGPTGRRQKAVAEYLSAAVTSGRTLAEAMDGTTAFPSYVTGLVDVGEKSGRTEETLKSLSEYYYKSDARSRQVKSALTYPVMLFGLMLCVVIVLLAKVLPIFDSVYASLGSGLEGVAGQLLSVGNAIDGVLPIVLAILGAMTAIAMACISIGPVRNAAAKAWAALRGDKGTGRKTNDARFAQAMAMGLGSGLDMEESIRLAARLHADTKKAKRRCDECVARMESGEDLADALSSSELLPQGACALLALGQRSGTADEIMASIAERLSDEADDAIARTVSRIEPALVIGTSLVVGIILIAVMLPLMDVMSAIG